MNNPLSNKPVPESVKIELGKRSTAAGIQWAAKRFPWIHVTSMCAQCPTNYTTLSSLKNGSLYESDYKRPLPAVTQVQVKKLGELGTTRRATISLTAFTDEQVVELQKCYFIPGMGCRVEWGWSQDASGKSAPTPLGKRDYTDPEAICRINKLTESNTHYNGIQGIVSNFSYELTSENVWNCSIEVIAAAEAVGGTKLNDHSCNCPREYTNEQADDGKAIVSESEFVTFLKDLYESFDEASVKYSIPLTTVANQDKKSIQIAQYVYNGSTRDEQGGDASGFLNWVKETLSGGYIIEAYISWSTLEAAITRFLLPSYKGQYTLGRIASPNSELAYHPYVESVDPRVCVLPGSYYYKKIVQQGLNTNTVLPAAVDHDGGKVYLDNIMINTVMLMQEAKSIDKGDGTIASYMLAVLNRINEACGNLWEFVIISHDDCTNKNIQPRISIAETKAAKQEKTAFSIPANAIGDRLSVLRDLSLKLKLTDSMKTQALYSNSDKNPSAKADGGGSCGFNAFKPFGLAGKGVFTNLSTKKPADDIIVASPQARQQWADFYNINVNSIPTQVKRCVCQEIKTNETVEEPTFEELMDKLVDSVNDATTTSAKSELMKIYGESANSDESQCVNMLLPFEFSFTLDGIGGFVFGQAVTCSRIPQQISSNYIFQVTAVEHSITANDWTTTVNTIARYNPKKRANPTVRPRQRLATPPPSGPIANESGIIVRPDVGKI